MFFRKWVGAQCHKTFQQLYTAPTVLAFEKHLTHWYYWATHCRLKPMIRATKTIKRHWQGVLQWKISQINNGILEGLNSVLQQLNEKPEDTRQRILKPLLIYSPANWISRRSMNTVYPLEFHKSPFSSVKLFLRILCFVGNTMISNKELNLNFNLS